MRSFLRPALSLFLLLSLVTGLLYPMAVTGVAQVALPEQANGSLLHDADGQVIGSRLIGQAFTEPGLFWGRPSATAPTPYNAINSGGSNLGPLNPALTDAVTARVAALRAADPSNTQPVPVDLVTASGSGLDPHISVAAARYQLGRVARTRGLSEASLWAVVERHTQRPWAGVLGESQVNVVTLNAELLKGPLQ